MLVGWLALTMYVRDLTNPDNIVAKIEASLNCRAEIKEASLNLFETPMRMQLTGLALGERDAFVEDGVKMGKRTDELNAAVSIDTIFVELDAFPLLNKKLVVNNFVVERPSIKLRVYEDGNTSLDEIFRPPVGVVSTPGKEPGAEGESKAPKTFTADQLPVAAMADRVAVEDATIYATIDKTKYTVQLDRAIVQFINIDVDPAQLETHNSANLEFGVNISVDSLRHNQRFLELALDGSGSIQPFDPVTREFSPSLTASVTVLRDSFIEAMPMLDEIEDLIERLEEYGASLEGVRLRGDFSEDTTLSFNANRELITVTNDFLIPIDENFLIIEEGSRVLPGQNDHDFKVTFVASERLTDKAETEIEKFFVDRMGESAGETFKDMIMKQLKEEQFLVLRFRSKGDLGAPEVSAETPFGTDITAVLNDSPDEAAKEMKEKFENLLDSLIESNKPDMPEDSAVPDKPESLEELPEEPEAPAPSPDTITESVEETAPQS